MIRANERKVKEVVLNLLSNAIKFTPEGGRIDILAAMNEELVEVSVADTGVGIAPEDHDKVFEEFGRVGTADKKVEDTGLGLALSQKFVELHGGTDLGQEPGRTGINVYVHAAGAARRVSRSGHEGRHAEVRVHVREVREAFRADHDDFGKREGQDPVPDV